MNEIVLAMVVLLLLSVGFLYWQLTSLRNMYASFLRGSNAKQIEQLLKNYSKSVDEVNNKLDALANFSTKLHKTSSVALSRQGFIRFNPFDDTGGDQSFCLALIDSYGNGFILSSIHARTGTRIYAKEVIAGKSPHNLSDEETGALRQALEKKLPLPKA